MTLITVQEAATRLGVSTKFIRRRIEDGTLAAFQMKGSRILRMKTEHVDALLVRVSPKNAKGDG